MGIFKEQRALLARLTKHVASRLSDDARVCAVWLGGSLGRGEGDALSDIDLVVVSMRGRTEEIAASLHENLPMVGPVALVHEAPQNAPNEGAQLNVLYDTNPLPIYVDWNVWPSVAERPTDVSVLWEREPLAQSPNATFTSILNALPRGRGQELTLEALNHFRVFMTPILLKHAARGRFESVDRMLGYMRLPGAPTTSFHDVMELARQVLDDFGASETEIAIPCIKRYLALLARFRE